MLRVAPKCTEVKGDASHASHASHASQQKTYHHNQQETDLGCKRRSCKV